MTWNNETITIMGIISDEVYNSDYFTLKEDGTLVKDVIEGTTYKVINHTPDATATGFQALLLESGGEYVIAFRGTEPLSALDWFNNAQVGFNDFSTQYQAALDFVNEAYKIDGVEGHLTLTGHSLGGMLTQQVGAKLHIDGYAFNPYGMDRMMMALSDKALLDVALYRMMTSAGLTSAEAKWAEDHILNVSYNDFGLLNGDILSNALTKLTSGFLGSYVPIYGADENFLGGHSIKTLRAALVHYNDIAKHFNDIEFINLSEAYVSTQSYEKTESIFNDLNIYNASGLSFNFLVENSASEIITQAKGDNTVLYALLNLNPFAIVGNLPAYDNLNPDDYSDQFFKDAADYLYYSIDSDERFYSHLDNGDMYYESTKGETLYFWKVPGLQDINCKQFIFGDATSNTLDGGTKEDHLYGMDGDDTLIGGFGNDWLEGGEGADELYGGYNYDTYITDNGDTIQDTDGKGEVHFEGTHLNRGVKVCTNGDDASDAGTYEGNGGIYVWSEDHTLTFTKKLADGATP